MDNVIYTFFTSKIEAIVSNLRKLFYNKYIFRRKFIYVNLILKELFDKLLQRGKYGLHNNSTKIYIFCVIFVAVRSGRDRK